ncbi:MAG: bifunctional nuclease family protein [Chitinophagia bacterium]|nr:bifunctional nuclease family protein [Chitinophagia bacterium]
MKKIEIEIVALSQSISQNQSYAVILGEVNGTRRLPIVIGGFEAQAIAVALERIKPSRPLTHDLFYNVLNHFNIDIKEVNIYKLDEGIFFSKLICIMDGAITEIDSRTSDALALAVRADCRIFTNEEILNTAGLQMEPKETPKEPSSKPRSKEKAPKEKAVSQEPDDNNELKQLNLDELNELLQHVIELEDYDKAVKIRDEIKKRK